MEFAANATKGLTRKLRNGRKKLDMEKRPGIYSKLYRVFFFGGGEVILWKGSG